MSFSKKQDSCQQCGTCCTKGGPALHGEDILLLRQGLLSRQNLITIRKGEFAHNPLTETLQATKKEFIKLKGRDGTWTCCYYNSTVKTCSIYTSRPLACRTLKCWDPAESLTLVETDLLDREQILDGNRELLDLVARHNNLFALPDFSSLSAAVEMGNQKCIRELEESVNLDMDFRNRFVQESELYEKEELFLFGRPLFQLIQPFGLHVYQEGDKLRVKAA